MISTIEAGEAPRDGNAAVERLVEDHRRLVFKIASSHSRASGASFDDLASEGFLGLLKAAERFDPSKGVKFSTYATYWVRQAVLASMESKMRTVRIPWRSAANLRKMTAAREALRKECGREPSDEDVSKRSGVSMKTLKRLGASCLRCVSMDAPGHGRDGEESSPLHNRMADDDCVPDRMLARKESVELFKRVFDSLGSREAGILMMRFGIGPASSGSPASCESVGRSFGISRELVRRIQERSLGKLRDALLPDFDPSCDEIAV